MKKQLLLGALLMSALCVNAQIEKFVVNGEDKFNVNGADIVLPTDKEQAITLPADYVFAKSENVTMSTAFEGGYIQASMQFQGITGAVINGETYDFPKMAVQEGNNNPKGTKLSLEGSTAPTSGAVFRFDVKKDGKLIVFAKMSSNKEYYVWEGIGDGAMPVAHRFFMDWASKSDAANPIIDYTWPADDLGYIDLTAADIDIYADLTSGKARWPEKIALGKDAADVKKNGVGVMIFDVYADAETYLVHAAGSKITSCGAVFVPAGTDITELALTGKDENDNALRLNIIGEGEETGINSVQTIESVDAPTYNLGGRAANKGLLIQKGKKFVK